MKTLNLKRPIVFFDLETTGTNILKDRIVQIAAIKKFPNGDTEVKKTLVNPTIPIPKEAEEVHGVSDEMVKTAPTFAKISKSMHGWLLGSDLGGFNSDQFDIPLLAEEFNRVGIEWNLDGILFIDVLKIERLVKPNTLSEVYKRYTGTELEGAHDAQADTFATMTILEYQLEDFDLPIDVKSLEEFANENRVRVDLAGKLYENDNGEICYAFGKSKDVAVKKDPGFGKWMLNNDFPSDTKSILRSIFNS